MATDETKPQHPPRSKFNLVVDHTPKPLPNYTLSTVCPACGHDTFKLACKVRCPQCHFMWDCSEL